MNDQVPVPKDSATILLIRQGENGIEVFVQRRASTMAFAAGMTVFPGGGLSESDLRDDIPWIGPAPSWWGEQFSVDERLARGLVVTAVRETFEECGVLLAGGEGSVVADAAAFHSQRAQLAAGELAMAEFLQAEGLSLRTDLLRPWANWITPVGERRRYDVRFFVAELPENQIADGETSEAVETGWYTPSALIDSWKSGDAILLPPTWAQLVALEKLAVVADVLETKRELAAIEPQWVDGALDFPDAAAYIDVVVKKRA